MHHASLMLVLLATPPQAIAQTNWTAERLQFTFPATGGCALQLREAVPQPAGIMVVVTNNAGHRLQVSGVAELHQTGAPVRQARFSTELPQRRGGIAVSISNANPQNSTLRISITSCSAVR